ncbi:MAG: hypothetical protein KY476_10845 [Planctomycetes bacterium]|nr:hypothetical protein [Planctomycetota bacterium]
MSTLTSASTRAEVLAAYYDNASYEEDASVAKAKAFVTACRFLLKRDPQRSRHGNSETQLDTSAIRQELEDARAWISAHDTSSAANRGRCLHPSFAHFRD